MKTTTIETVSGRMIDLTEPEARLIAPSDIAWALSREPRFGGHTITELPFTVAQHSVNVMKLVKEVFRSDGPERKSCFLYFEHDAKHLADSLEEVLFSPLFEVKKKPILLYALLHDASEAYLRDLPSPVKAIPGLSEAYRTAEVRMMKVIHEHFELTEFLSVTMNLGVAETMTHWADLYARTIEAYHFMPSRGRSWNSELKVGLLELQNFELPKPAPVCYQEFLEELQLLSPPAN